MILQALCQYYDILLHQKKICPPGWDADYKVSFGLDLSDSGEILELIDFRKMEPKGVRTVPVPRKMNVPARVGRSGTQVSANFMCDNTGYMLGRDEKGKPERSLECFQATGTLHHMLMKGIDIPAAKAVLAFLDHWDPSQAESHPQLEMYWKDLMKNVNLIFCYDAKPLIDYPEICEAWDKYYNTEDPDAVEMQCLVTGEVAPIAATHPKIKGVKGAQSSGAVLVSFNKPAFCSDGHTQNFNAPISQYAAFAYTAALNYLLSDWKYHRTIGNTTIICWSEHGNEIYPDTALNAIVGSYDGITSGIIDEDLAEFLSALSKGEWIETDKIHLNPDEHFYFLGLTPNATRLSVQFFLKDTFGEFMSRIAKHYTDIAIVSPSYDKFDYLPLWKLLEETVNPKSKDKSSNPHLTGELLRAVLEGTPYPAALLNAVQTRIRAEREITRCRAAIIKGYYLRRPTIHFPKEVLTVEGNPESTNVPYTLGRLFATLEQIQRKANPDLNVTIKDHYFNSASATPANIFPLLINLTQHHLHVIYRGKPGLAIMFEKQIRQYMCILGENFPIRLTLSEQGAFQLGYYFEMQKRFTNKDKKNETTNEKDQ